MREFTPKTDNVCGIADPRGPAAARMGAVCAAVSLLLAIMPAGCRAPLGSHHARTNAERSRAGNEESRQQAEPSKPHSSPEENYLLSEVGEMMREDQARSGNSLSSRPPRPPPRRPGDAPLRPTRRPGIRPNGR